jgi:hypothetical protein
MKSELALILVLVFLIGCGVTPSSPAEESLPVSAQYQLESARLDLASRNAYYLELHVRQSVLKLCHSNTVLATYPVKSIKRARPAVFFLSSSSARPWILRRYEDGQLTPAVTIDRPRINPGDAAVEGAEAQPPAAWADIIAVPAAFEISFQSRFRLEVDLTSPVPGRSSPIQRDSRSWEYFLRGLGLVNNEETVIRLEMEGPAGASLYRSFPASPAFLVIP